MHSHRGTAKYVLSQNCLITSASVPKLLSFLLLESHAWKERSLFRPVPSQVLLMRFRGDLMTSEFDTVLLNGKITSRAGIAPLSCRILTVHAGNWGKVAEGETGREPPQPRPDGESAHSFPCLHRSSLCGYGEIWGSPVTVIRTEPPSQWKTFGWENYLEWLPSLWCYGPGLANYSPWPNVAP